MAPAVEPIPAGYPRLTAYIIVSDAAKAIEFYKQAFGAEEEARMLTPGGKVAHAELRFVDSILMLADEQEGALTVTPEAAGATTAAFSLYVEDADKAFDRAIEAGATSERPVETQFYGDRSGTVKDPFGHYWSLMTHVEDVAPEEMARRMTELYAAQ